ncbi:MAG: hypothetical protein NT031_19215 [Planctomycetota bacterium]|nr:hypothetical protein [Planctomycetota bacterium]
MCGVSVATVVEVAGHIGTLDLAAKEKMCDELAAAQPHMLSCVLVLPRLGVPMATVDHVIHVLLVVSECARRASAGRLPEISMAAVEQAAGRINAMLRLLEGESPSQVDRLTRLTVLSHPEQISTSRALPGPAGKTRWPWSPPR